MAVAFFLAELGDKTMLADALAIVVGQQLDARLPERTIKIGAAITFVAFGLFLVIAGLL